MPAEFSVLSIFRMIWLNWPIVLLVWIAVAVSTFYFVQRLPRVYSAEAQILVDPQKIPASYVASTVNTELQDRLATLNQQILSSPRLQKIIDDFDLYRGQRSTRIREEILQNLQHNITIRVDRGWTNNKPGAFRIGFTGSNPAVVAGVANRLANLYIEENMRTRETQAEGTAEFINSQLAEAKQKLSQMEARITEYKVRHNGELPEQANAITSTLNRLQLEQNNNREAIARAENSKVVLESTLNMAVATVQTLAELPPPAVPGQVSTGSETPVRPTLVPPRPQKASEILEAQLASERTRHGDQYPEVKRLKAEIAEAKAAEAKQPAAPIQVAPQITETASKPRPGPRPVVQQQRPSERTDLALARERAETLKSQIDTTQKEIDSRTADQVRLAAAVTDYQNRLNNIPVREQELADIERDHAALQGEYQALLAKSNSAQMSTDMELRQKSERFTINDPARVPQAPISPNRPLYNSIGVLGGLVLGVLLAVGRGYHKGTLLGRWELPEYAPILAEIPSIAPAPKIGFGWGRSAVLVIALLSSLIAATRAVGH